jgi:tight adherence protein C
MLMPIMVSCMAFGAVFLVMIGVSGFKADKKRLAALAEKVEHGPRKQMSAMAPGQENVTELVPTLLQTLGDKFKPKDKDDLSEIKQKMIQAGIYLNSAVSMFWGIKIAMIMAGMLFFVGAHVLMPDQELSHVLFYAVLIAVGGFYGPDVWLRKRTNARKKNILNALPDALDLLVVCVESGVGLDQAMERVGREMHMQSPILSDELRILNLELRAGKTRVDAMKNLAKRIDLDDINSLTTLIIQADSFGTSVADTLRVYSDAMRTKRHQRAEETAAKLPVKMLMPLILFIMPALFAVLLGPAAISIMDAMKLM